MKFLVDECLNPRLVNTIQTNHSSVAICVRDVGLLGAKDWDIARYIVDNDYVLITHNSKDFRGRNGYLTRQEVHPGLICLNSVDGMTPDLQRELLEAAFNYMSSKKIVDLLNHFIEVDHQGGDDMDINYYEAPQP